MPLPPPLDPAEFELLLGLSLAEFRERASGVADRAVVRVVAIDGQSGVVTTDYSPLRVNVAVAGEDQIVVAIDGIG